MGAKTEIAWSDSTPMFVPKENRFRYYKRLRPERPGTQIRRRMAAIGKRWCRGCIAWLPAEAVSRQGVCKIHANEEYRINYAGNGGSAIRATKTARKRRTGIIPTELRELLFDLFYGQCAYCENPASTLDHIIPVVKGGLSVRGNLVPACRSCNSRKRSKDLEKVTFQIVHPMFINELAMEFV